MKMIDAAVVWTPTKYSVRLAKYPDYKPGSVRIERHHSTDWQRTAGDLWMPAIYLEGGSAKDDHFKQLLGMFILFNTLVVRDGIDPKVAHEAFLKIDEYRRVTSSDAEERADAICPRQ